MAHAANITCAKRLLATAILALAVGIPSIGHAEDSLNPPAQARAMTGLELYLVYRDKSWRWPDGAGRMETDGRHFTAIAGSGSGASWAEGRWIVTDRGRLCLDAQWHTPVGNFPDRTCFEHRLDGNTIYQRRAPAGTWNIFKHSPAEADDEFTKLVREDLVSAGLEEVRSASTPQQLSSAPSNSGANDNE
jgi:hypothetical protein